jgi:hypothetical protein
MHALVRGLMFHVLTLQVRPDGSWSRDGEKTLMVTQNSATSVLPNISLDDQIPIMSNHSDMVKFPNNCDMHYITVRDRLRKCMEKAPGIIEARFQRLATEK